MTIVIVVGICVLVLVAAFVAPRMSRGVEKGGALPFRAGERVTGKAPGKAGKWLSKPFSSSRKAVHKSGSAGRRGRSKLPL